MKKLAVIITLFIFSNSTHAQGCGAITKGMLAINKSKIEEAQKLARECAAQNYQGC